MMIARDGKLISSAAIGRIPEELVARVVAGRGEGSITILVNENGEEICKFATGTRRLKGKAPRRWFRGQAFLALQMRPFPADPLHYLTCAKWQDFVGAGVDNRPMPRTGDNGVTGMRVLGALYRLAATSNTIDV